MTDTVKEIDWVAFRADGCPCCAGTLASFSPSGRGRAACDACHLVWGDAEATACETRQREAAT